MSIGSSLGITLPTQGSTLTWGSALNTELNKIITAVEGQVPASAIDFSANFDVNGYSFTSIKSLEFDAQATSPTAILSAFFNASGEFTVRDGANNEVVLTSAGGLNNASAGGLGDSGGTYGTSGITFDWDNTRYNAKNGSGSDDYADIRLKNVILRDGSSNDITLAAPSLAGNYTFTFPATVPGTTGLFLQGATSGVTSFSNSTAVDITLTGTAEIKHGSRTKVISSAGGIGYNSAFSSLVAHDPSATTNIYWEADAAGDEFFLPIDLEIGDRITSIACYVRNAAGAVAREVFFQTTTSTGGGTTNETASSAATANSNETVTMTVSPQITLAAGSSHVFRFIAGAADDRVYHIEVTYDRP